MPALFARTAGVRAGPDANERPGGEGATPACEAAARHRGDASRDSEAHPPLPLSQQGKGGGGGIGVNGDRAGAKRPPQFPVFAEAHTPPGMVWGGWAEAQGQDARRTQPGRPCPGTADFAEGMPPAGRARPYPAGAQRPARPAACPLLERPTAGCLRSNRAPIPLKPGELPKRNVNPRQRVLPAARPPFSNECVTLR